MLILLIPILHQFSDLGHGWGWDQHKVETLQLSEIKSGVVMNQFTLNIWSQRMGFMLSMEITDVLLSA